MVEERVLFWLPPGDTGFKKLCSRTGRTASARSNQRVEVTSKATKCVVLDKELEESNTRYLDEFI